MVTPIPQQNKPKAWHASLWFWLNVLSLSAFGQTGVSPEILEFVRAESEHNKVLILDESGKPFDTKMMPIEHLEIPLDRAEYWTYDKHRTWYENPQRKSPFGLLFAVTEALPPDLKDALIHEQDGQRYLRWLLSPDDQTYGKLIVKYFKALNVSVEKRNDVFRGIRTASRSIIGVLPNGHAFSFKPSTDRTSQGSNYLEQRPYPARWVSLNVQLSEYFRSFKDQFRYLDVAWEAAGFAIPPLGQQKAKYGGGDIGFSIRLMEETNAGIMQEYSGFIWSDKAFARQLAKQAKMNYSDFWKEAFFIKGQAMAELAAFTGFKFTSAHSQNVRFMIDTETKRVVKVRILDLTDGKPMTEIFELNGAKALLQDWKDFSEPVNRPLQGRFQLSWFMRYLDNDMPRAYRDAYVKGVKSRLQELTNLDLKKLRWMSPQFTSSFTDNYLELKLPNTENMTSLFPWMSSCSNLKRNIN